MSVDGTYQLGEGLKRLRADWREGRLSASQVEQLAAAGLTADPRFRTAEVAMPHLVAWQRVHGGLDDISPRTWSVDGTYHLGKAVAQLRDHWQEDGRVSPQERQTLLGLGFNPRPPRTTRVDRVWPHLVAWKEAHGSLDGMTGKSMSLDGSLRLGAAMVSIRSTVKTAGGPSSAVSAEEIQRLTALGFDFAPVQGPRRLGPRRVSEDPSSAAACAAPYLEPRSHRVRDAAEAVVTAMPPTRGASQ